MSGSADLLDELLVEEGSLPPTKRHKPEPPFTGLDKLPAKTHASPARPTGPPLNIPGRMRIGQEQQQPVPSPAKKPTGSVLDIKRQADPSTMMLPADKRRLIAQTEALGEAIAANPVEFMSAAAHHKLTTQQQDQIAVAIANNPKALAAVGEVLNTANANAMQTDSVEISEFDALPEPQHQQQQQEIKTDDMNLSSDGQVSSSMQQLEQLEAGLQSDQQQQQQQQPVQQNSPPWSSMSPMQQGAAVQAFMAEPSEKPNLGHLVSAPAWVQGLEVIKPDPNAAWRRRCPPGLYFLDIAFEDLYIRANDKKKTNENKGEKAATGSGAVDAENLSDVPFTTICSKKQGTRPLRYRSPILVNGEALLGYGNWKGLPSNEKRKFCPQDIKQAKQQVCVKARGWNGLTVDMHGQDEHALKFFQWRTNLLLWYAEQCIRLNLALKYVEKELSDDMTSRRKFLAEQVKGGQIGKQDAVQKLAEWKLNPPMDFDELLRMFIKNHTTQPVKLRNAMPDGAVAVNTAAVVAGVKRKADSSSSSSATQQGAPKLAFESKSQSGAAGAETMDDADFDNALNPVAAKTGMPHTEYMILEKKVLRHPSKLRDANGQSEYDTLHSKPYVARTPLLQCMWDKHGLIYNDIKFVSLAKGGSILDSAMGVVEQSESQGLKMPEEFKARRRGAVPMAAGHGESKSSSSNGNSNTSVHVSEPGMTGSLQPGGKYTYNNPSTVIDWNKASIRAGDLWAFEVEVGCFTESPQKTVGIKDQPVTAFFYRHSRMETKEDKDDTSIDIPGAEAYQDRRSSMLTDDDLLKALADTEASVQNQRPQSQYTQPYQQLQHQQHQQAPGEYKPVLFRH